MILFKVQTHGYVAIGFSPNGGMKGSDIIFAGIENDNIILQDMYATDNSQPILDLQQGMYLFSNYSLTTGCFNSVIDTLTGYYGKNSMCKNSIMEDLFSVYADISFHGNKSEKITEIS